jgi:hypothetical protein
MLKTEIAGDRSCMSHGRSVPTVAGLPVRTALVYALLFAIAFCFYTVIWPNAPIAASDTGTYFSIAQDISNLHISRLHYRTPGYPLLLVLTGAGRSLFLVALILHFAAIWLLGIVLYRAGLSEVKLNFFSGLLLLPPFVEPAGYILSETLTEALLVAAFASFIFWHLSKKIIWILISATIIGYAGLTRPTYQVLALAVAGWFVVARLLLPMIQIRWRDITKASLILVTASILIVGGYAYFNYRNFGYFGITPILGLSLSQKTVHVLERLPDEHALVREVLIKARNAEWLASGGTAVGYILTAIPELTRVTGLDWVGLSQYMLKLDLLLIQKAPLTYLVEVLRAFNTYCFPTSGELANFGSRWWQFIWAVLHFVLFGAFVFNLILLVGSAAYIKRCGKLAKRTLAPREGNQIGFQAFLYGLAGTIVVYTAVISCFVDAGDPRHRVPTDALIVFMLFVGTDLWRRLVGLSTTVLQRTETHTDSKAVPLSDLPSDLPA